MKIKNTSTFRRLLALLVGLVVISFMLASRTAFTEPNSNWRLRRNDEPPVNNTDLVFNGSSYSLVNSKVANKTQNNSSLVLASSAPLAKKQLFKKIVFSKKLIANKTRVDPDFKEAQAKDFYVQKIVDTFQQVAKLAPQLAKRLNLALLQNSLTIQIVSFKALNEGDSVTLGQYDSVNNRVLIVGEENYLFCFSSLLLHEFRHAYDFYLDDEGRCDLPLELKGFPHLTTNAAKNNFEKATQAGDRFLDEMLALRNRQVLGECLSSDELELIEKFKAAAVKHYSYCMGGLNLVIANNSFCLPDKRIAMLGGTWEMLDKESNCEVDKSMPARPVDGLAEIDCWRAKQQQVPDNYNQQNRVLELASRIFMLPDEMLGLIYPEAKQIQAEKENFCLSRPKLRG